VIEAEIAFDDSFPTEVAPPSIAVEDLLVVDFLDMESGLLPIESGRFLHVHESRTEGIALFPPFDRFVPRLSVIPLVFGGNHLVARDAGRCTPRSILLELVELFD
jgi:hypothetical protein